MDLIFLQGGRGFLKMQKHTLLERGALCALEPRGTQSTDQAVRPGAYQEFGILKPASLTGQGQVYGKINHLLVLNWFVYFDTR